MKKIRHVLVFLGVTLSVGTLAALVKINHLQSGVVSAGKTEVTLKVTVRGTGGRPVKNAVISVFDPAQITLGKTNDSGVLATNSSLSSGRSLILQAEGAAFKMQRTLLIPRASTYNSTVFFDLAEVHEGHATLLTTENTESTRLVNIATPKNLRVGFSLENFEITQTKRLAIEDLFTRAAIKLGMTTTTKVGCKNWNGVRPLLECELTASDKAPVFRVFNSLPEKNEDAERWLFQFNQQDHSVPEKKLGKNELMFVFKHNGTKFRPYLDQKPMTFWKERKTEQLYRVRVDETAIVDNKVLLTLITENDHLLQRQISWPRKKRVLSVRLPKPEKLDLSKR